MQNETRSKSLHARIALAFVLVAGIFATASVAAQSLQTIAGGLVGDGATPANASLNLAFDIALDASGNLYVADNNGHRVRKVTPAGVVSTFAGTGLSGSTGDGGPATQAKLNKPHGLAFDSAGNLYISERAGNRIRKVTPAGTISTVAGDGSSAILDRPQNMAVAPNGTIYVSESTTHRVKKVVGGVVSPFAGNGSGGYSGDGGPATTAQLFYPEGLIVMPNGSVLIADDFNNQVRRVDPSGTISSYVSLEGPTAFAYNAAGELHVLTYCQVYKVDPTGATDRIIGDVDCPISFGGDGGPQDQARFDNATAIAIAADGRIYINDYLNERVRLANAGTITTFVGPGASGEGASAIGARVSHPAGVAYDSAGNLYVSERFLNRIRKITPAGVISTYAGNGQTGFSGDGGPATAASFDEPRGLAFDQAGNLLVADYANHRIRAISPGGTINTIAGTGNFGVTGDGVPATLADLGQPDQISVNAAGDIYFSQSARLRRIRFGTISTVAGGGAGAATQSGVQATSVKVGRPGQIGFDSAGNVYFTDSTYHHVRRIDPIGIITTVAGDGSVGSSGDGGAATLAKLTSPRGLVVYPNGDFLIADATSRVRKVSAGTINTVAGTGTAGFNGDGSALTKMLDGPTAIALAPGGGIAVAELNNSRVRKLDIAAPPQLPGLSISDQSVVEGNSGTREMIFTVSLSQVSASPVTFGIATGNGSAASGSDFLAMSLTGQTMPAGVSSMSFAVTVNGDATYEPDENFTVVLSNVSGASAADVVGVGTIVNDDSAPPTLSVGDVAIAEGNSGTKLATFTVTLSAAQTVPVFFDAYTANGTATAGDDYVAKTLTGQRITVGSTSKTFTVTINGDVFAEASETFTVNLTNPVGAGATIADAQAIGTITSDDAGGSLPPSILVDDVSIVEGDSGTKTAVFTISLSAPVAAPVNFDILVTQYSGSATQDLDFVGYTLPGQTFSPGQVSKAVDVVINGDNEFESDETFFVAAINVNGATLGDDIGTGTIIDDDADAAPLPHLWIDSGGVQEGNAGKQDMEFQVHLSQASAQDVSFNFATADNNAVSGQDYDSASGTVVIPAGMTAATITIAIQGDTLVEPVEYFKLLISNVVGADTYGQNIASGQIFDDDTAPLPFLSISNPVLTTEGNTGTKQAVFTVQLSAPSSTDVTYSISTINDTATAPSDFVAKSLSQTIPAGQTSKTFSVTINGDSVLELDEEFDVLASNINGAQVTVDLPNRSYGRIVNDDGVALLSIGDVTISEGNSGTKNANFTVSLSQALPDPVNFSIRAYNGTASEGSDFVAPDLYNEVMSPGQTSKVLSVAINGDTTVEADESFTLNLSADWGVAGVGDGLGVVIITNDDAAPPTLSIGDVTIAEGNSLTKIATFTVTLSAPQATGVTFDLATASGSAEAGTDFVGKSTAAIKIPAGSTSRTFQVTINGDTTVEPDEAFFVNLSNPVGATIADGQGVGTISNDDAAPLPTLSIGDVTIPEGNSLTKTATFTVTLSAPQVAGVTFDLATASGSAEAGTDFVGKSTAAIKIPAGTTTRIFQVTINGDTTVESDETFTVNLSNLVGTGVTIADGQAVGTITNDDAAPASTLSIGDVTIAEGNSLTKTATFTVTLSSPQAAGVTFDLATASGSAEAGTDFVGKSTAAIKIPAGTTSRTFLVTINGDKTVEPDETFFVNLSNPVGAGVTIADGQAVGTISNDDAAALTAARFATGGLVDDIDDGNHGPQLSNREYTLLLADTARQLCARTGTATLIGIDGVENRAVLADLADAANLTCAGTPRYQAVMAEQGSTGFLVEATSDTDARGVHVIAAPALDTKAGVSELTVQASGHARPITLLLPQALPSDPKARSAQLLALGQRVASTLKADPQAQLVLIGGVTLNALRDLSSRDLPRVPAQALPAERILLSPALQRQFGKSTVEYLPATARDAAAQVLHLQQ